MNFDVHSGLVPMDTVFLHGNLASNTWWTPAIEVWKRQAKPSFEGRLLLGEWRGCGKSNVGLGGRKESLHPSRLADDYLEALRAQNVKRACLVGHSTGGLIALYMLLKEPTLFDRVVLLDPVAATGVQFEAPMYDAFTQMSRDRAMCTAVMNGTIHGNDPESPLFKAIVEDAFGVAPEIWHGVPDALKTVNILSEISRIEQPMLVLHGEHDTLLPMEGSRQMAETVANGRFIELKGQGHSTNVENPELFVKSVNEFLFQRT